MAALFLMGMVSCTKEGPTGPAGADGQNGLDGQDGQNGQDGKDGNANVVTYVITDSVKLLWVGNFIQLYYDSVFSIPDSILDEGLVLVYMKFSSSLNFWYAIPGWGNNGTCILRSAIGGERIALNIMDPDGTSYTGTPPVVHSVRVVLVSPSAVNLLARQGHRLNLDDHDAVIRYFALE